MTESARIPPRPVAGEPRLPFQQVSEGVPDVGVPSKAHQSCGMRVIVGRCHLVPGTAPGG
ncbi:hypothetical protein [Halococcus sp. IIIV-5B]|uniref:hypothetical protein n=1 Tax=Halococcus sp. IIIV-5B TaxID=2321230 RepID=UPI001F459946|nr:hypothetical protein [Halococcus sp. IIIV-5B]